MVDMVPPHQLPERDDALDTAVERALLQSDFPSSFLLDVNREDRTLQECLGTDGRLPLPELWSPSRATSYRTTTTTTSASQCAPCTPDDAGLRTVKADVAGHSATEWHMSFDELVRPLPPSVNAAIVQPVQPPDLIQPSYFAPGRSLSKRGRQDTSGTLNGLSRKPSKRHKQVPGGFPCDKCHDTFDRACDQAKHFKRAHGGDDCKPHSCSQCTTTGLVKKFLYPKDLRRHLKQVHMIITHGVGHSRPADPSETTSPASPTSPHAATFWTLTKAVQRFKQLRLSALSPTESDEEEKYIMVSADKHNFVDVDVTGITAADALITRILTCLKMADVAVGPGFYAQIYKKSRGSVQLGDKLNRAKLLSLINQLADSQGSLKLVVHISRPVPLPTTAEARMFAQQ